MRLTLATKTAILTTSLVLFLVGATAVFQYRGLSDEYVKLVREQQQDLTDLAAADLDYKLSMHLTALAREARRADAETFATAGSRQQFLEHSALRPMFDGVALVSLDGKVIANEPPLARAANIADRDYFRRVRERGEPTVSAPLKTRTTGQPAVIMAVPVKDAEGRVTAVLAAALDLNQPNVLGGLARARVGDNGYFLVETNGVAPVYVVHPDSAQVLRPARYADARLGAEPDTERMRDITASSAIAAADWTLRTVLPSSTAYAPLAKTRKALTLQMALLAVLCGGLVWAGSTWLMRPFATLHQAIRALRRAPDSAVALDVRARDERGDLAREFDALMTELRNRRAEMAAITDASPMGLFRVDLNGDTVYANEAYLSIQGLDARDSARGWLGLVDEDKRERAWADWLQRVAADTPYQIQRWLRRKDGSQVLIALNMRPILEQGRVIGQVGTLADMTERRRAEQAVRTLSTVFEATTDYVVQLDSAGRLTYMNPAARKVVGIAHDAPIDHLTLADLNPPDTVKRLVNEVVPIAAARGVWVGESDVWDAERCVFPVSHMVIAHKDRQGRIERYSGIMRDISTAKTTERALQESEARLRTMADALPVRVAYIDAQQRYRFVNKAYDGVFGFRSEAIPGYTVREIFGNERYKAVAPHVEAALAGEHVRFESEMTVAGKYHCYEADYIPQADVDGTTIVGFHAVTKDITRQKQEERRLKQLASQDPLTGLGNRSAFDRQLAEAMARSREQRSLMALMYLDLDRFKQINDRYGHQGGDAMLEAVADRLTRSTRTTDFAARLGGDEFVLIMQSVHDVDIAARVAQKILSAMNEPFHIDGQVIPMSASVGVAFYAGGDESPQNLVQQADEMLYRAKGAGRNNFQLAEPPAVASV